MVQIGKKLKVISYTQASRRFKKLNLKIDDHRTNKDDLENIEIAVLELVSTVITVGIVSLILEKENTVVMVK